MQTLTEIHAFAAINALGETVDLGSIDATGDTCISQLFARVVRNNPRFPGLAVAIDAAFHACEMIPGNTATGETTLGSSRIVCTRALH